jgi:hypothetical protein
MNNENSDPDLNINIVDPNIRSISLTGVIPDNRVNIGGLNDLQRVRNDVDSILTIVKPASEGIHTRYIASFDRPEGEIDQLNTTGSRTIKIFDPLVINSNSSLQLEQSTILEVSQTPLYVNNTGVITLSDPRVKKNIRPLELSDIKNTIHRFESVPIHTYEYNKNAAIKMGFKDNKRLNGYLSTDFSQSYPDSIKKIDMSEYNMPEDTEEVDIYKELLSRDVPVILRYLLDENRKLREEIKKIRKIIS